MKRFAAIFIISVLAFNLAGYHLFINWLQEKEAVALSQKIDSGINEVELISVKVPAALPYYTNSKDFQWTDGEVMIEGVLYQYVQRRIWNDSIEFRCLKNEVKTNLLSARDRFFNLACEMQSGKTKSASNGQIKPLLLEYCASYDDIKTVVLTTTENQYFGSQHSPFIGRYLTGAPGQPPEAI